MLFNTDYVLDHLLLHDDFVYLAFAAIFKLRVTGFNIFMGDWYIHSKKNKKTEEIDHKNNSVWLCSIAKLLYMLKSQPITSIIPLFLCFCVLWKVFEVL